MPSSGLSNNSPSVGLATRAWLGRLSQEGMLLDRQSWDPIQRALDKCRQVSPAGMVHDLALRLGASAERALLAGSVSELFYAACSLTDDLQDGDTDAYLGDLPFALRLNAQSHLLCLVAARVRDLSLDLVADIYRTGAAMLTGQRIEISRDPWNVEAYEKVARLSAGEQFGTHLSLAAIAAGKDEAPWRQFGRAWGMLLQLVADREARDPRLLSLDEREVGDLWQRSTEDLRQASFPLGEMVQEQVKGLLERCPAIG